MNRPTRTGADDPALWLIGILIAAGLLLWSAAQLAALLHGSSPLRLTAGDLPGIASQLPHHLDDPRHAFPVDARASLPGPVLTYLAFGLCLATVAGLGWFALSRLGSRETGHASRREIRDQLSLHAVRQRAQQTRPSLDHRRAAANEVGLHLGRDVRTGIELYGSVEDSYLYLGPPRSGKGVNLVIPQCLAAPGAVVVTATRPDTLRATIDRRRERGPVAVFDPQGVTGLDDRLRWSPVHGCADPLTAILRARALTAGAKLANLRDGEFWDAMAQAVVRCYLHAADLDGLPVSEVITWVSRPADPAPVRVLRAHPEAAVGWADELAAQSSADHRQRDSVWAGVRRAFDALADPRVLDACSPPADQAFDVGQFLDQHGTLYLVGSTGAQLSVAPLVAALIEDVVETGRRRGAASAHGRLDPPLLLLLDEAANIAPIPSLPSLLSDGGGSGITTVAVLQSLAQARARWGEAHAESMWDAATIKVVLGGLAHAEDLQRISRLAGEIDDVTESVTRGGSGKSVSTSVRRLPALPVERLRGLPVGRAVVLGRRARPVEATLQPYWST
jgi:type IV secretory pathway TraG/TraD family ATPase VirD4